jgi:UTP--glucose-1-phosphate uridylyltransferase
MIKKIVIPSAGLGTRLLPVTKEIPKEMMPLFFKNKSGEMSIKPLIQILFEKFFSLGIKEYCIIVGRQKRTIEDHFTTDQNFLKNFKKNDRFRNDLEKFYSMLNMSKIFWINQQKPKGFGDAVLYSESFVGSDDFLVSAGDTLILNNDKIIKKMIDVELKEKNDALLVLKKVTNPKRFGVAVIKETQNKIQITNVEEKPVKPKSNLSIVALYRFKPSIFKALREIKHGNKELQLTDAIQKLIEWGGNVQAILLDEEMTVIDVGTAESYLESLQNYQNNQ